MEDRKNLCAQIPLSLHQKVREEQEKVEKSLSDYITMVLTEYYNQKGVNGMSGKTRTLAFQVSEELYQRVKVYLAGHAGLSQKDFVVGLIEQALAAWEPEQTAPREDGGNGAETPDSELDDEPDGGPDDELDHEPDNEAAETP